MALLLSFDTATKHLAVCLADNGQVLASRTNSGERHSHAEELNVFIDEVVRASGRSLKDIAAVAVGIGPGSYTGCRIGLSAAKGLSFALDIPLIGISSLTVLSDELRAQETDVLPNDVLMPMIDARRMEVFTARIDPSTMRASEAIALVLDEAGLDAMRTAQRSWVFGDGADKAAHLWRDRSGVRHAPGLKPSVNGLARAAQRCFINGLFADAAYLVPDYVKAANVTEKKPS